MLDVDDERLSACGTEKNSSRRASKIVVAYPGKMFGRTVCCCLSAASTRSASAMVSSPSSFYALSATQGDGTELAMEALRGRVVYAVNVASK